MTKIDPTKKYDFPLKDEPDKKMLRIFHTKYISELMCNFIIENKCRSYLELGCGFGGVMYLVSKALREINGDDYILRGCDIKPHRVNYAKQLLAHYGVKAEVTWDGAESLNLKENVDVLFIDCGYGGNQIFIDNFSDKVNKAIFVHDVTEEYKFPAKFKVEHDFKNKIAKAVC